MPCFHPITAWRSRAGKNENGSWPLVFNEKDGYSDYKVLVPCGRCVGCRLDRSRDWAVRLMHESSLYDSNLFVTLTYDNAHLPLDGSLNKKHFQDFMKRLRKEFSDVKIRYFHCGEYGGKYGRPHYHAILFNLDFSDKLPYKLAPDGSQLYISNHLNRLWSHGFCVIGGVTFESCAYVARYIMKKQTGEGSEFSYLDPATGLIRQKEYITMSRRPGIGGAWFKKYHSDVFPRGFVLSNGHPARPPRFYVDQLDKMNHEDCLTYKNKCASIGKSKQNCPDNHPDRLCTREQLALLRTDQLVRPLDANSVSGIDSYVDLLEKEK